MKLEWRNDEEIGYYECVVTDNDGYTEDISLWDFTCEYQKKRKQEDYAYARCHPYAYEVRYCRGYSMHETFDDSHTLEWVKVWCEDYLLDGYINHYNDIIANFEKIKSQAGWAIQFKVDRAITEKEKWKQAPHTCELCGSYIERDVIKVCDKCASEYEF